MNEEKYGQIGVDRGLSKAKQPHVSLYSFCFIALVMKDVHYGSYIIYYLA